MTDTAANEAALNEVAPKDAALDNTAPGDQAPIDAPQPEPAANSNAGVTAADVPPPEAPLKATKAKALTSSDRARNAREKAADGKFPPLEDILTILRFKHLMDGELPDEQSGNFEAPDFYDWADLLPYVQHETGKSAKDLMENTLAGFPSASAIHHAEKQFAGKYKRYPIMEDGAILAPGGLRWIVLQAVEKQVMSKIKAPPKGAADESAHLSEVRRYKLAASVIMMDQNMGADVKKAIETHRNTMGMGANAQRRLDAERAARITEEAQYRLMDMANAQPAMLQVKERRSGPMAFRPSIAAAAPDATKLSPSSSVTRPPKAIPIKIEKPKEKAKEFDIETLANVVRAFVRANKRPPIKDDYNAVFALAPNKEIRIGQIHDLLTEEIVQGGETLYSLASLKSAMGLINAAEYRNYEIPLSIPISARATYDTLLAMAQTGQNLNLFNKTDGRKTLIGEHKAGFISIALQNGTIEGWEDLVKHLGLPESTPAPVCLYDFMVETKLATRNKNYELVNSVPAPEPSARIKEIAAIAIAKRPHKPQPGQKPKPPAPVGDIAQIAARLEEKQKTDKPKAKKLPVKSEPKPVAISRPKPQATKYEIAPIIAGTAALTRANKKPPTSSDTDKIIIGDKEIQIYAVDDAFKSRRVKGAESIKSFSDFKARFGYVNRSQIERYETPPLKEISAKAAFDMVSGYVAAKRSLPSIEKRQDRAEKLGEYEGRDVNVIQLSLAFQDGVVTGWDKITQDCTDLAIEGVVPVPTCLYEFLTACNFARRKDDLTLEIFPIHAEADLDALLDEVLGKNPADDDPSEEEPEAPAL
jgi:hypothetical protein